MTKEEVISLVDGLARANGEFYGFSTITRPHMKKTSRATGLPFTGGEVTIHATFSAMLGISYENAVNNERERNGEERNFVAQKPNGKHYVDGSRWLMTDDRTGLKFYVALDRVGGMKKVVMIDGRPATEEEVEDLKANFWDKPSPSKISGLWRTYSVESIVSIS